eukprot:485724_1
MGKKRRSCILLLGTKKRISDIYKSPNDLEYFGTLPIIHPPNEEPMEMPQKVSFKEHYVVEKILKHGISSMSPVSNNSRVFFVKWENHAHIYNSWVEEAD